MFKIMSKKKKFLCVIFLVIYIIVTVFQGIAVSYYNMTHVYRTEIKNNVLELHCSSASSAQPYAYHEIRRTEGNCVTIKPYYYLSPLFRGNLWHGSFVVYIELENVESVKIIDDFGGEYYVPIPEISSI